MDAKTLKARLESSAAIRKLSHSNKSLQMPSVLKQVGNVTHSIVKNVQSVANGNPLNVSEFEKENRLAICNSCKFFDKNRQKCSKCGCFMSIKTYLKAEKCPIGLW